MDGNYIISHVNHAMASMLDYKVEEMIGKHVTDFMLKEDLSNTQNVCVKE